MTQFFYWKSNEQASKKGVKETGIERVAFDDHRECREMRGLLANCAIFIMDKRIQINIKA